MNQSTQILEYLKTGESISPLEALQKFGSFRLSERIREIQAKGYEIEKRTNSEGKRFMIYKLKAERKQEALIP